jgi:hypothetical protein
MARLDAAPAQAQAPGRDAPIPSFSSNWFAPVLNIFRNLPDSPLAPIDDRIAALRAAADGRIPALVRGFAGRLSAIQAAAYGEAFNWGKAVSSPI